jgi:hypothetical protein
MTTTASGKLIWVVAVQAGWYGLTPHTHRFIAEGEKFQCRESDFSDFDRNEMIKDAKGVEYKRPAGWMRRVKDRRELEKAQDGKGVNPEPTPPADLPKLETEASEPEPTPEPEAVTEPDPRPAASGRGRAVGARARKPSTQGQ